MKRQETDQLGSRLKSISSDIKLYIEKRVELLLLNIGEHFSRLMAESVQKMAGVLLITGATVCLLVALALYIGDLLNSPSLGYVIVSIPLLVTGLLFMYLRPKSVLNKIQQHFESEIVKALSQNGEGDNEKSPLKLKEPDRERKSES